MVALPTNNNVPRGERRCFLLNRVSFIWNQDYQFRSEQAFYLICWSHKCMQWRGHRWYEILALVQLQRYVTKMDMYKISFLICRVTICMPNNWLQLTSVFVSFLPLIDLNTIRCFVRLICLHCKTSNWLEVMNLQPTVLRYISFNLAGSH